jgi:hypothetical protein
VTKVKAFNDLDKYILAIDQELEENELPHILTFYLYHFCRVVANESDRQVREAAHKTFSIFVKNHKKKIGPHLKKVTALWMVSFFDPSAEASQTARQNFEQCFPPNKRGQAFQYGAKNLVKFAAEQFKTGEDQMAESSVDLSQKQKEEVFDRIVSGAFLALAESFKLIEQWTPEEQAKYKTKMVETLSIGPAEGKKPTLVWTFLQTQYRGRVRAACLSFATAFLKSAPADLVAE